MENRFLQGMAQEENWKETENGAAALKSTLNTVLDLFGTIGALRRRSEQDICNNFMKAYNANKLLTMKMLFYARNIRGGLGERRTFRTILVWLAETDPENLILNFENIALFGRWDDFYALVNTPVEKQAFEFMHKQFIEDLAIAGSKTKKNISLLGKWLKSVNSHSHDVRRLGQLTCSYFGLTEKQYRKSVSLLRKTIKIVEAKMSAGEWGLIKYEAVPSNAMHNYRKAFDRHDEDRFRKYLDSLKKGETKINASTLYPYNLIENYLYNRDNYGARKLDPVIEEQWKALPNYIEGENNFLVMADTSGSMSGRPMATSVGLAIYFAQRNSGPYKNKFLTFSEHPTFVTLHGETLRDCAVEAMRANWGMNTDIAAAFRLILKVAVENQLKQEELPKSLIIVSDMEFDHCTYGRNTFYDTMSREYRSAGYELPKVVFWNVDARHDTFHAHATQKGVQFISGQSPSAFLSLIKGAEFGPIEMMLETLNDPVYDSIKVVA